MNTPVDFPTAKLLKEKGFDERVKPFYNGLQNNELQISDIIGISNQLPDWYPAPTIAEVVCWIYSKYQIWIQVSILKDDEWHYSIRRKDNNWNIEFPTKEKCISIENAYEKGINVVLNTYKPKS